MTNISIHYYDADTSAWVDLTSYATAFHTEDWGIQKVGSATINLEGTRSNFSSFLTNPYRLMRVQVTPNVSAQNIFYGYIDVPNIKTIAGTITERVKLSLDCLSFESRLAQDYVTFNFYDLMSAAYPHVSEDSWSFRKMINYFLAYPDSRDNPEDGRAITGFEYGTGFTVDAAEDLTGIDRVIDGTGNWDNQTLFEAIRLSAEHIGYDGYYNMADDLSATTVKLYPFNKPSTDTLTAPFIGEPEWIGGSLADVANIVFVKGSVDRGIPSDGDRFTEYGVSKYNPVIWTGWSSNGTTTVSDQDNTQFIVDEGLDTEVNYGANAKCVRAHCSDGSSGWMTLCLNLSNTEFGSIDALKRCSQIDFTLRPSSTASSARVQLKIQLSDINDQVIEYLCARSSFSEDEYLFPVNKPTIFSIPIGQDISTDELEILGTGFWSHISHPRRGNVWRYYNYTSNFDWEHIKKMFISVGHLFLSGSASEWYFDVDGLQFVGGLEISEYNPLNPPAVDSASINKYGVHPYKHTDSQINSFEQAQAEAARILNNLHEPIPTLQVRKLYGTDSYGTTWATQLRPSNVATCQTVDYRLNSVFYDWNSTKGKRVEATYNLVGKTSPLPPIWTYDNALRYLMK